MCNDPVREKISRKTPLDNFKLVTGIISMKIKVDHDLCESNQLCVSACPQVFEMDDDDELVVLIENPGESLRDDLIAAVNVCPRLALSIED